MEKKQKAIPSALVLIKHADNWGKITVVCRGYQCHKLANKTHQRLPAYSLFSEKYMFIFFRENLSCSLQK